MINPPVDYQPQQKFIQKKDSESQTLADVQ